MTDHLVRPELTLEQHQNTLILLEVKELRADVKSHILETRDRLMKLETQFDTVPNRVTALESFRWKILGGVTVISAACAYIFRHIGL
jgi:hypothetical protein